MKMSAIFSRRLFCRGQGTTYPTKIPPRRLSVYTQDPGPPVCRRCHGTGKYRNLPQLCSRHIVAMSFSRVEAKERTNRAWDRDKQRVVLGFRGRNARKCLCPRRECGSRKDVWLRCVCVRAVDHTSCRCPSASYSYVFPSSSSLVVLCEPSQNG